MARPRTADDKAAAKVDEKTVQREQADALKEAQKQGVQNAIEAEIENEKVRNAGEEPIALVLPKDAVSVKDTQTLGGLPGVWTPGKAVSAADMELSNEQAQAIADDPQNPLEAADPVKPKREKLPVLGAADETALGPGEAIPLPPYVAQVESSLEGAAPAPTVAPPATITADDRAPTDTEDSNVLEGDKA